MGEFFVYILKSSVCLTVFYLFYRLFLSRETFYNFNRIAILGILILSMVLPFCEVTIKQQTEVQQTVLTLEQLLLMADKITVEHASVFPVYEKNVAVWIRVLLLVYLGGILFFVVRNIYSFLRLIKLIRTSVRWKLQNGIWIVTHFNTKYSPFSWMRFIVISTKDFEENSREILIHEAAHIRKRHSIDLLITDLCIILQWFNPAAWLFKQELQNIHEYQADEAVLNEGVNAKQYQLLLIEKAAGTRLYSMANSFNHSKLKKRITMMLKRKSNPWARLKYLYVLPVAAIAVTAFARPEITRELNEISAVNVHDLAGIVEKKSLEIQEEAQDTLVLVAEKVTNKPDKKDEGIKSVTLDGYQNAGIIKENSIELITSVSKDSKNAIRLAIEKSDTLIGGSDNWVPRLRRNFDLEKEPLYIIDGKVEKSLAIDPKTIHSLTVLKSERAVELYGEGSENGVVVVHTKEYEESLPMDDPIRIVRLNKKESAITLKDIVGNNSAQIQFVILDGEQIPKEQLSVIDPSQIESLCVLKSEEAKKTYGEAAENGAILITTKHNLK